VSILKSRYVCAFNDRNTITAESLGTKGVAFAEMSQAGIPVPAGFTVTTESCARYYDDNKVINDEITAEIRDSIGKIEILTGKTFGGASNPLFLSVRSNSRQSVPGLMETILHLGMNDTTAEAISIRMSDPKTAYEYYLNFISVYSAMIKRFGKKQYASILEDYKSASGKFRDEDLSLSDLKELIKLYKESYKNGLNENFPSDPYVQLINAIGAGFHYWDSPRANYYRMVKEIPYSWGTAVTVQTMVYGNFLGDRSGTGVAFTRNPSDGKKERLGEFLLNSRTGDVLSGNRTPDKLDSLLKLMPDVYEEFERDCFLIEKKYHDIFEINFTIEDGNFFIIKTRKAKRTALAAFTAACDFTDEGICSEKDAIKVLDPANITSLRPTNGFEELFDESDDEVPFETPDMYASNTTGYAATGETETPDTSADEQSGGIYNYSLFDYELDDIMTEIYSGFNVYDEDIDDRSLTDELKRIVTERIPALAVEEIPETSDAAIEEEPDEDPGDYLPEIETEEAEYTEYSGYNDPSEMAPVGLFNDAFKSAREMAAAMNFEPEDYIEPEDYAEEDDSYYAVEEDTDNYYKTKAFADELNSVDEALDEEDIEKRLESGASDGEHYEFEALEVEAIPEELPDDPFTPLLEPPLTANHAEPPVDDTSPEADASPEADEPQETSATTETTEPPKHAEPLSAHERHIFATAPIDIEEKENRSMFSFLPDDFDKDLFDPEEEINISEDVLSEDNFLKENEDDGFLFDDDFDYDDDLPLTDDFGARAAKAFGMDGFEPIAEPPEEDEVSEVADEASEVADEASEISPPVSADELLGMIDKATLRPHKIKVTPIRRK
jgi:hypothetical protein